MADAGQPARTVELIVEFDGGSGSRERAAALDAAGMVVVRELAGGDFAVVAAAPGAGTAKAGSSAGGVIVDVAAPVPMVALSVPDDPKFAEQWHLEAIQAPEAWDRVTGDGVVVAVVDSGVAADAPDLAGTSFAEGYDFVDRDDDPDDPHGHGTHVAGTIAQTTNDGYGAAGAAPGATILAVRVLDEDGVGTDADVAEGIRFAVEHGAEVINLSLGGPARSRVLGSAVRDAVDAGVVVVAAAGNEGGSVEYPAAYADAIAVGAIRPDRSLAPFSSVGAEVDLVAPGVGIIQQTRKDGGWCWCSYSGTSMAAPLVSATAALLLDRGVESVDEVRDLLGSTAVDLGPSGDDDRFGAGLVQAADALDAAGTPAGIGDPAGGDPSGSAPGTVAAPLAQRPPGTVHDIDDACPATAAAAGRYADVEATSVHARAIDCVSWLGLASGVGAGAFGPAAPVSRAQMATFLVRFLERAGVVLPATPPDTFTDDQGEAHEAAVNRLAAIGVVRGTAPGTYSPRAEVSRAAMATFLAAAHERIAATPLADGGDPFHDDDTTVHEAAIGRLARAGIATGTAPGAFTPGAPVTRAQMATFLARTFDALVDTGDIAPPPT